MAARKLSLQPLPLIIRGRGRWKGMSPFKVTSATAVCRLSKELDFFRPREGPTSLLGEPWRFTKIFVKISGEIYIIEHLQKMEKNQDHK